MIGGAKVPASVAAKHPGPARQGRSASPLQPGNGFGIAPASWRDFREILALERLCFPRDPWPWFDVLAALTFPETVRLKAVPIGIPKELGTGVRSAIRSATSPAEAPALSEGEAIPLPPRDGLGADSAGDGTHAVGFVIGDRRRLQKLGWVESIGVHPAYQRRGVGALLLEACERALGTPRVRLTLRPSNLAARRLYQAAGYVETGSLRGYYHDGEDGLMMEKVVSGRW